MLPFGNVTTCDPKDPLPTGPGISIWDEKPFVAKNARLIIRANEMNSLALIECLPAATNRTTKLDRFFSGRRGLIVGGSHTHEGCLSFPRLRYQHADAAPIVFVLIAVEAGKISLLELNRDKYVSGRDGCEKQMTERHQRRRPERNNKSDHDRMPDDPVERRSPETEIRVFGVSCSR